MAQGFLRGCVFTVWDTCFQARSRGVGRPQSLLATARGLHSHRVASPSPPGCRHAMAVSPGVRAHDGNCCLSSEHLRSAVSCHPPCHCSHCCCCRPDTPPLGTTRCDARRWGFLGVVLEGVCHLEAKLLSEFHG